MLTFGIYIAICLFIAFVYLLGFRHGSIHAHSTISHDLHRIEAALTAELFKED